MLPAAGRRGDLVLRVLDALLLAHERELLLGRLVGGVERQHLLEVLGRLVQLPERLPHTQRRKTLSPHGTQ